MNGKTFEASESALIPAPAQAIYDLLIDYRVGHPSILPKPYFRSLTVESGGLGAGTVFTAEMEVSGRRSELRMKVSEPRPGQLLQEETFDGSTITQFRLQPEGNGTRLTLHTLWQRKPGFRGWVEKMLIPGITRKIYVAELKLIVAHFSS